MLVYLACFDIADNRVRTQVGKLLGRHGKRVQKSVFEIAVRRPDELAGIEQRARALLQTGDDLRFYRLCQDCRKSSHDINGQRIAKLPAATII